MQKNDWLTARSRDDLAEAFDFVHLRVRTIILRYGVLSAVMYTPVCSAFYRPRHMTPECQIKSPVLTILESPLQLVHVSRSGIAYDKVRRKIIELIYIDIKVRVKARHATSTPTSVLLDSACGLISTNQSHHCIVLYMVT